MKSLGKEKYLKEGRSQACNVKLDGDSEETIYESDQYFEVPASSGFEITVQDQICQYVCRFLD